MGSCFSSSKVSGSNSNTPSTTTTNVNVHHNRPSTTTTTTVTSRKQEGSNYNRDKGNINTKNSHQKQQPRSSQQNVVVKPSSRRQSGGVIPCGKRTDFGYDKDFDKRYTIGKLLGHGQFGYTYVATDRSSGDRVAVKKIEKNKVLPY